MSWGLSFEQPLDNPEEHGDSEGWNQVESLTVLDFQEGETGCNDEGTAHGDDLAHEGIGNDGSEELGDEINMPCQQQRTGAAPIMPMP